MYTNLAYVYDNFMQNVPYDKWFKFILKNLNKNHNTIVDLGCGTGILTQKFYEKGYDITGIDKSKEMIKQAINKNKNIKYLSKDFLNIDDFKNIDVFISTCDSLNYIIDIDNIFLLFQKIYHSLNNNGLFIFDLNSIYKYKVLLGNNTYFDETENSMYIINNSFSDEINEYSLTLFNKTDNDLYQRYDEFHYQRYYSIEIIYHMLKNIGYSSIKYYSDYENKNIHNKTEKYVFVVRK